MKDFVISVRIPESFLKLEFLVGDAPIYLPVIGLILKFKKAADINKMVKDSEAVLADAKKEYEETGVPISPINRLKIISQTVKFNQKDFEVAV